MVETLVDTSVVVDIFRAYPSAIGWLDTQTEILGVTRFVWQEVIEGCPNKRKQQTAIRILERFELIPVSNEDIEWATNTLIAYHLKGNIDSFDCLIAATAHRLQIPLYTRNLKHFMPILGNLAQKPY